MRPFLMEGASTRRSKSSNRGKPKAALISIEDYERLLASESRPTNITRWLAKTRKLSRKIERRRGRPVGIDAILATARDDIEDK